MRGSRNMRSFLWLLVVAERWCGAASLATAAAESVNEEVAHRHRHRRHHRRHHHRHHSLRPIITGCLEHCGYEDQHCVTQCQVCAEAEECRSLSECDKCLREASVTVAHRKKADKTILDAGGVSLMRDGLLAEMTRARLEALDKKRQLKTARAGVLTAQREKEYATEERHNSAAALIAKREVLKKEREGIDRWKLQNEKKLKTMRAKARLERLERQRAERRLREAKKKYSKAREELRTASNETIADGEEVWKAGQEVEKRQKAVEELEAELEKDTEDGEWLDRGLQQRVKRAQKDAKKTREELQEGRARERVARDNVQEAKDKYLAAVSSSQQADKAAQDAEKKLREAPTSAKEAKEQKLQALKELKQKATNLSPQTKVKGSMVKDHPTPSASIRPWLSLFAVLALVLVAHN